MATMICNRADITNLGEAVFYDAASAFLNKNIIVYHNRDLVGLEFDFLLVIPQVGLCVIEVKGWHEQTVIDVQPTGTIVIQGKDHQLKNENPRKQALSYCYVLQNKIASMTGKHPLVFHMVCYPYLSRSFIEHRGFYANDELKLTLSKEDLESAPMLKTKLQTASGLFGARTVDTLDHSLLYHIRRIFEPEYIEEPRNESGEDGMSKSEAVYPYSIVAVMVKSDYNYTSQIDRLVESYAHGTKVFAIFSSEKAAAYALNRLQTTLDSKVLSIDGRHLKMSARPEKLSGNAVMIFNWNSYVTTDASSFSHIRDAWIVDGQCGTEESILLKTLDQMGLFNEQQFLVEHAPIAENILVRAGAGTGKTAVMIDRISYLVYKHQLTAVELADCVLMITFTNDAADNMQDRLKQRFQDYYLLTGKSEYLEMIAGIGHMQISTIHSYAKNIITKLGTTVGYGQKLQIEAGQYNRDKEIEYLCTRLRAKIRSKKAMASDERTIAVLVRENWQAQEVVLYGREKKGIMIETAVGGELFSSTPALEMLTLLQTLAIGSLPVLNKFAQSNFIGCELNKEAIYSTGHKGLRNTYSKATQIEYITRLIDVQLSSSAQKLGGHSYDSLASIRHALRTMPILQVMHQLYTQLAPWDSYGVGDKERCEYYRMNVDALFELLTRNGSIDGITLNSLMAYIGNCVFSGYNQECRYPPKDDKGIRILCTTVHKAKGLEYGYVILPYTSFKIDGFKKSGMDISVLENGNIGYNFNYSDGKNIHNTNFNRAEESQERKREETRILYVAMTRAEHGFTWLEESGSRIQASWKALLNMEANP